MTTNEIKELIKTKEYDFLRENKSLGNNGSSIILLTLGGSHAYGTNVDTSDVDIRGCALNSKEELLTNKNFEQFIDNPTDTVIYSFNKIVSLFVNTNPNVIELLGCKQDHYIHLTQIGQELLDNKKIFLSKRCINSFGGYANQQLMRLKNNIARYSMSQSEKELHMLDSINSAMYEFASRYTDFENGNINLSIDKSDKADFETEIFMDVNLNHYPLRDYKSIWSEMNNIVKDYSKIGVRNKKKDDMHMNKHMMHLVRLYMMCIDILSKEEINTYRNEKELELLMSIRNGKYLQDGLVLNEFWDILNEYTKEFNYAKENTSLPSKPNDKIITDFIMSVNERVVKESIY